MTTRMDPADSQYCNSHDLRSQIIEADIKVTHGNFDLTTKIALIGNLPYGAGGTPSSEAVSLPLKFESKTVEKLA